MEEVIPKPEKKPFDYKKLLKLPDWRDILLIVLILILTISYKHDTGECYKFQSNPCTYCKGYYDVCNQNELYGNLSLNISINESDSYSVPT